MNRAEAKIAVRDQVLANVFEAIVGEGTGKVYLDSVREADARVDAALKEKGIGLD